MLVVNFANPVPVPLTLLNDGSSFELQTDLHVSISENDAAPLTITIPAGYVTDLASIPPEAGLFGFNKLGKYSFAAIVHDYMFSKQMGFELANAIFYSLLKKSGLPKWQCSLMASAVQIGGRSRYRALKREEQKGGQL
jgi:hypothetical protein